MKRLFLFILTLFVVVESTFAQSPSNDEIQDAIEITSLPFIDINVSVLNANTPNTGTMSGCNATPFDYVYYKMQPATSFNLAIDILNPSGNSFALVYQASSLNEINDSNLVFASGQTCDFNTSNIVGLQANIFYYILVGNESQTSIHFYNNDIDLSQIINFTDPNLKNALINTDCMSAYLLDDDIYFESTSQFSTSSIQFSSNPSISLDFNNDGEIQLIEALSVRQLNITSSSISDLSGLESFANLKSLYMGVNNVSDLSPLSNLQLEVLSCPNNPISNINGSQNIELKALYFGSEELNSMDLSQNINLLNLSIINIDDTAQQSNFSITSNTNLLVFRLQGSSFTSFDVSNNTDLIFLSVDNNNLSNIDLSQNSQLETLFCSFNNLTQLDTSNNFLLGQLYCVDNNITSINVSQNSVLRELLCYQNDLTNLDVTNNLGLVNLICYDNDITNIDVTHNLLLEKFFISNNNIQSLDITQNVNLREFTCRNSALTNIDLSQNSSLRLLSLRNSNLLETINLQNGNNQIITTYDTRSCTNLQTVCVDDIAFAITNFTNVEPQTIFVEDCNATSINYNLINGIVTYDNLSDGCDVNDLGIQNVMVTTTDGINQFATFTQSDGGYLIDVVENTYSTSVNLPPHFSANPNPAMSTFNGFGGTDSQDFCITANQAFEDFEVSFLPLEEARPGFDTTYQLVFENRGVSTITSGSVTLQYDDGLQQFVSATPSVNSSTFNSLTFNYSNLLPFENRVINLTMNTFQPPTVQSGDILNFTATIEPLSLDNNQSNNTFLYSQQVVNSFDPNDITVLQGESIFIDQVNDNLDYIIRFQNTGTASAINVVITHDLDDDLDWSSFRPISSSHDYRVQITNGDFVEFIFENINLPDVVSDEPNSQGFVAFKIKPKSNAIIGDVFGGLADIYFDFNAPIRTNFVFTEIVEPLSIDENTTSKTSIYPNPTNGKLFINSDTTFDNLSIFDINGRLLKTYSSNMNNNSIELNLKELNAGVYFLKISSFEKVEAIRFIKN